MTQQEELKIMSPETSVTLSTGETISITPFKFGQLPKVIAMAGNVGTLVSRLTKDSVAEAVEQEEGKSKTPDISIAYLVQNGGEDLINLIGLGIGKPRDWFDNLDMDDGVTLATSFVEVNVDFFIRRVLPQLNKGKDKFKAFQKQSQSSSVGASPTTT